MRLVRETFFVAAAIITAAIGLLLLVGVLCADLPNLLQGRYATGKGFLTTPTSASWHIVFAFAFLGLAYGVWRMRSPRPADAKSAA